LAALENGDAVLKCFAVGKPEPRIRWYKINTDNGEMEGNWTFTFFFHTNEVLFNIEM